VYRLRHHATEVADEFPGHPHQMFSLVVWIAYTPYVCKHFIRIACSETFGFGKPFEQRRRYLVDPLIGALSRQDDSYQQFVRIPVIQFCLGVRIVRREIRHKSLVAFFFKHVSILPAYMSGARRVREYDLISLMTPDRGCRNNTSSSTLSM